MKSLGWQNSGVRVRKSFVEKGTGKEVTFLYNPYRYQSSYGDEPKYRLEGGYRYEPADFEKEPFLHSNIPEDIWDSLGQSEDYKGLETMKVTINSLLNKIKEHFKEK